MSERRYPMDLCKRENADEEIFSVRSNPEVRYKLDMEPAHHALYGDAVFSDTDSDNNPLMDLEYEYCIKDHIDALPYDLSKHGNTTHNEPGSVTGARVEVDDSHWNCGIQAKVNDDVILGGSTRPNPRNLISDNISQIDKDGKKSKGLNEDEHNDPMHGYTQNEEGIRYDEDVTDGTLYVSNEQIILTKLECIDRRSKVVSFFKCYKCDELFISLSKVQGHLNECCTNLDSSEEIGGQTNHSSGLRKVTLQSRDHGKIDTSFYKDFLFQFNSQKSHSVEQSTVNDKTGMISQNQPYQNSLPDPTGTRINTGGQLQVKDHPVSNNQTYVRAYKHRDLLRANGRKQAKNADDRYANKQKTDNADGQYVNKQKPKPKQTKNCYSCVCGKTYRQYGRLQCHVFRVHLKTSDAQEIGFSRMPTPQNVASSSRFRSHEGDVSRQPARGNHAIHERKNHTLSTQALKTNHITVAGISVREGKYDFLRFISGPGSEDGTCIPSGARRSLSASTSSTNSLDSNNVGSANPIDLTESSSITEPETKVDPRLYRCEYCGFSSRNWNTVKIHLKRHQGVREFICRLCLYHFVTRGELNRHFKSLRHIRRSENVCYFCGEGFISGYDLENHLDTDCQKRTQAQHGGIHRPLYESTLHGTIYSCLPVTGRRSMFAL